MRSVLRQLLLHRQEGVTLQGKRILKEKLVLHGEITEAGLVQPTSERDAGARESLALVFLNADEPVIERVERPACVGGVVLVEHLLQAVLREHDVEARSLAHLEDVPEGVDVFARTRYAMGAISRRRIDILEDELPIAQNGLKRRRVEEEPFRESGKAFERIICHAHKLRSCNLV